MTTCKARWWTGNLGHVCGLDLGHDYDPDLHACGACDETKARETP